ncbi:MAG TPA: carboxypeptidase-like regulatory domain-containing protein, partial [Gemmatimonadales bacterium]|nr:carboxypeptidase-like regulatory domain-containing protein [Gemmatimonadales bacterium]
MGARSRLLPLLALAGFLPGHAAAQAAAILVRDGTGGPPVAGAIVRLLRGDSVLAQGLTGETGRVTLRAPSAGRYFLQVSRIGYVPGARTPVDLVSAETRSVDLPVLTPKILLPEIIVEAKAQCGKVTAEGALAATLLYQVRQALTATSLSERRGLTLNSRDIDRTLSAGGAVLEERPRSPRLTGSRPFVPAPPEVLAEQGYVRAEADSVVYSAPDADLLLSDPFVETHCFGVRSGPLHDSLTVGLTFEPVKRRRV